jgi:carbamoyl-phosphate synthase large subunit
MLNSMGLKFYGTRGTAEFYKEAANIDVEILWRPFDNREPSILTYLIEGKIDLVINIPKTAEKTELDSDYIIRRKAVDMNVPLITNIQFAKRFVKSISRLNELHVKSWDEYI